MPRGRPARRVLSNRSDDIDDIKAEMAKLKAQLRIVEGERQAYILQSQDLIRRQRREIERLRAEQEELQRSLRVCESYGHRQKDVLVTQDLLLLLDHREEMDRQLEREALTLKQLDKEILSMERRLLSQRKSGGGWHKQRTQVPLYQKTIRTLEDKLDRAVTRFNTHVSRNGQLREDLEALRTKRSQFQQRRHSLERELQEIRKDISNVIKFSTAVYDARVEVQMKMLMMKKAAVKDLAEYSREMRELERVIAQERHLQDFMNIKRRSQEEGLGDAASLSEVRSQESAEEMFSRIRSLSGEEDLDLLVNRFIQNEDQNFALFKKITEQNNAVKTLKDQINQIQKDSRELCEERQCREAECHALLGDLQAQQRAAQSQADGCEERAATVGNILDKIRTGMDRMLRRLKSVRCVAEDLPGVSEAADRNLLSLLALVQQSSSKLLNIQAFIRSKILQREGIIGPSRGRGVKPSRLSALPRSQRRRPEA
ncbi:coiled-coil domain-containing protein 114 [Megalops cyprinoides]|uniref:coiled-coil domain-containing protein 114 n=1 Tax=Megalops cyprinoides TaxID=118141 RepID=UPI0018641720|nr:coiled-coil domain-containing protein 114 [Megalops cyprinoides]